MKLFFTILLLLTQTAIAGLSSAGSDNVLPANNTRELHPQEDSSRFLTYFVAPNATRFYWKDERGQRIRSLQRLADWQAANGHQLLFAMNGGMYRPDGTPQGLYIENGQLLAPLDGGSGPGNFYLQPNGVCYITNTGQAVICRSGDFRPSANIRYATQSGPMLLINGQFHPSFIEGSPNLNIRNAVGLLPDGRLAFVLSRQPVNFCELARYFQSMGCRNALYLDGFVSRAYLPAQHWMQTDGDFGVIIAQVK